MQTSYILLTFPVITPLPGTITLRGRAHIYTGHTQKNGADSIGITIETAPFFCVCPVYAANLSHMSR